MLRFSFDFSDADMPRTIYYQRLVEAMCRLPGYTDDRHVADVLFPAEDAAVETNWPRFARAETAYIRGGLDPDRHNRYLDGLALTVRPLCIVNMHPFSRVPLRMMAKTNVVVADVNLRVWERALNPRTISMPALPVTVGGYRSDHKHILAGFRGAASHPCRHALAGLHNGTSIVAELVGRENHAGRIDAENGITDPDYVELMAASIFAFVPRGEAEFSYRLLEAMSFGCIPIVISDGLVLPFDRSVRWPEFSLHLPENRISEIPDFLRQISPDRVTAMQNGVVAVYRQFFGDLHQIAGSLLSELDMIRSATTWPSQGDSRVEKEA
jgi:hypothetical protein